MKKEGPKILIDSSSPQERRGFLKRVAAFAAGVSLLGGFTNTRAKNTFSGKEISTYAGPDPYIGSIAMNATNWAPRQWAPCDGQIVGTSENPTLFALIGNTYGGNGTTNYRLPDFRGRTPVHLGTGIGLTPKLWGSFGGTENVILTIPEIPSHSHSAAMTPPTYTGSINAYVGRGGLTTDPDDNVLSTPAIGNEIYSESPANTTMNPTSLSIAPTTAGSVAIGSTGGTQPHNNMQPWIATLFMIAIDGLFPPRN